MKSYQSIYKKQLKEGVELEWEIKPGLYNMTFKQAKDYALSLGDSWRLPTIEDLGNLFYNKSQPFDYGYYWSSSLFNKETRSVFSLKTGEVTGFNPNEEARVICCRQVDNSYENTIETLLTKHLKKNYGKSATEIDTIVFVLTSILNELEIHPASPSDGVKIVERVRNYLEVR